MQETNSYHMVYKNTIFFNMFMTEGSSETTREAPIVLLIKILHLGEDIVRPGRKLLL